ncbi:MAG: TIGR02594 family protein [Hyphomicrobium sp.]|nr:TIGR02594 family protein [Hyphomicrobium sp.]
MQQPSWMAEAWRELGQSEIRGPAHNPRIVAMFDELGHHGHGDETAWCAAFVGVCLERAGIASTRSLRARSYLDWGAPADPPSAGAIVVLQRGSDPALGHVGFLVGMTGTHVIILGGNQANAVNVSAFDQNLVLGFRQPGSSPATDTRSDKFDLALRHVLAMEGGWTDDPHDPRRPCPQHLREPLLAAFALPGTAAIARAHALRCQRQSRRRHGRAFSPGSARRRGRRRDRPDHARRGAHGRATHGTRPIRRNPAATLPRTSSLLAFRPRLASPGRRHPRRCHAPRPTLQRSRSNRGISLHDRTDRRTDHKALRPRRDQELVAIHDHLGDDSHRDHDGPAAHRRGARHQHHA